jgi:hypothetical protein
MEAISPNNYYEYWWNLYESDSLDTLIIQTTHDALSLPDSTDPCSITHQLRSLRRQMNTRIKLVLLDRDLFRIATRCDWHGEAFTMEAISPNNYYEYWWNLYESDSLDT